MAVKSDHITRQRTCVRNLITALDELIAAKREYDADGYNHPTTGLLDADFVGANSDITAAQFKAAVNGAQEINSAFTAGGTITAALDGKLYKLR